MELKIIIIIVVVLLILISSSSSIYFYSTNSSSTSSTPSSLNTSNTPSSSNTSNTPSSSTPSSSNTSNTPSSNSWDNLQIGQSVKCSSSDPKGNSESIYRYMGNGILDWYPNPAVAGSLDPNWGSPTAIDCTGIKIGQDAISGNENDTAKFTCNSGTVNSGTIIYGTQPNNVLKYNIPVGTSSLLINNTTMGSDPNPGVVKTWGAAYTCSS